MSWKVMVSAPYMLPELDRFLPTFQRHGIELVVPEVRERLEEADLLELVESLDGVICGDDRFTERVLAAAPKLKVISKWGTGIDSIDRDACKRRGIRVCNTPNAFSEPVADSVLGYMLCFARNITWADKRLKAGHWSKIPGRSLGECTLGVIGVGDVGQAVVRRAAAFSMRILGADPIQPPADFQSATGLEMVTQDELLRQADFVSLNCDLNPSSRHLVSRHTLRKMQQTAVLINTARGPLVDELALVEALQTHQIAGAALDVFESEPLPADSPLCNMDNVLLAPHNSNSSPTAWERVHQNTISNLLSVLHQRVAA